jgi:hypothetical protein
VENLIYLFETIKLKKTAQRKQTPNRPIWSHWKPDTGVALYSSHVDAGQFFFAGRADIERIKITKSPFLPTHLPTQPANLQAVIPDRRRS